MDMLYSRIQVRSIEAFTCQHFQQLFSDDNKSGTITTTNNGRAYHVIWEAATDTISVTRDMTNVGYRTRFAETLSRWANLDFTNHAEKWQRRLMLQKQNMETAQPVVPTIEALLMQIDGLDTRVAPSHYRSENIQADFNKTAVPLLQLLEEKKQNLSEQAQQLLSAVTTGLPAHQRWTRQEETLASVDNLQKHVQQLSKIIVNSKNTLALYALALGAIDVSKSAIIYDAFLTRYTTIVTKIKLFIQAYFDPKGSLSGAEVDSYNTMIQNERLITDAFLTRQVVTHFAYNKLLAHPCYAESGDRKTPEQRQKQRQIKLNYQPHIMALTNVLIDPAKTFSDIEQAAQELKVSRNRWQEQIRLEEKTGKLLDQLRDKEEIKSSHPVWVKHVKQLEELQKNMHNHAELLSAENFKLLQSRYTNIERADTLHSEIGQFLNDLPGFIAFWKISNYNDEMQSRIVHLSVLRSMCQEEVSLTGHALDHMEHVATMHKNVLRQWINSDAFSRLTFYEPISNQLSYPAWLVEEQRLFQQKAQGIKETLWATQYQLLRNEELLKARQSLLEETVEKTETLAEVSADLKEAARKLRNVIN